MAVAPVAKLRNVIEEMTKLADEAGVDIDIPVATPLITTLDKLIFPLLPVASINPLPNEGADSDVELKVKLTDPFEWMMADPPVLVAIMMLFEITVPVELMLTPVDDCMKEEVIVLEAPVIEAPTESP